MEEEVVETCLHRCGRLLRKIGSVFEEEDGTGADNLFHDEKNDEMKCEKQMRETRRGTARLGGREALCDSDTYVFTSGGRGGGALTACSSSCAMEGRRLLSAYTLCDVRRKVSVHQNQNNLIGLIMQKLSSLYVLA